MGVQKTSRIGSYVKYVDLNHVTLDPANRIENYWHGETKNPLKLKTNTHRYWVILLNEIYFLTFLHSRVNLFDPISTSYYFYSVYLPKIDYYFYKRNCPTPFILYRGNRSPCSFLCRGSSYTLLRKIKYTKKNPKEHNSWSYIYSL